MRVLVTTAIVYLAFLHRINAQECDFADFGGVKVTVQLVNQTDRNSIDLKQCPMSSAKLPKLTQTIWCSDNAFPVLKSHSIANLANLETINLESNDISSIESSAFSNLPKVLNLNLNTNNLKTLKNDYFRSVPTLERLSVKSNLLQTVEPDAFKSLRKLRILELSSNELTVWNPEWLAYTKSLWSLNVQGNRLTSLPEKSFGKNNRITTIDFSNNQIVAVDVNAFKGLNSVDSLYLNDNKIESFHPDTFAPFNGSLILDKGDRRRIVTQMDRHMHATFSGVNNLYINNNLLTYLPSKVLSDLHKTSRINFHSNPWQCGCYWKIMEWAKGSKNKKGVDVFRTSCVKVSNPICVSTKENPDDCIEEVNAEVRKYFLDNYVDPNLAVYDSDDLDC